MKKILIVTLFFGLNIFGQQLPTVVPQSPNAAEFARYGEIPVSYYTGVPNISVPIYTIKSGEIDVPLTLSYHAGGIKVSQEASWVGLGWSLSQGGLITRNIRGKDDIRTLNSTNTSGYPSQGSLPEIEQDDVQSNGFNFPSEKLEDYSNIELGDTDPVPDSFTYNILGYSGTFIMPKNYTGGVSLRQNGLLFEYVFINSKWIWIVTDTNGWKYYIDIEESTETFSEIIKEGSSSTNSELPKITSWYLSKVITPKGDKVTFIYNNKHGSELRPQEIHGHHHD